MVCLHLPDVTEEGPDGEDVNEGERETQHDTERQSKPAQQAPKYKNSQNDGNSCISCIHEVAAGEYVRFIDSLTQVWLDRSLVGQVPGCLA